MHAPLRRRLSAGAMRVSSRISIWLQKARSQRNSVGIWIDAVIISIRDRNGYLLILMALIVFDYCIVGISFWTRQRDFFPSGFPLLHDFIAARYVEIAFTLSVFAIIGYALFGWLAFRRAQGESFKTASTFRPISLLAAFGILTFAADFVARSIMPGLYLIPHTLLDTEFLRHFLPRPLICLALYFIASYLVFRSTSRPDFRTITIALLGYIALTHAVQIYGRTMGSFIYEPTPAATLLRYSSNFIYTAAWNWAFVAFCIVIGTRSPSQRSQARNVAPHTE
jgi:hypothetical protein